MLSLLSFDVGLVWSFSYRAPIPRGMGSDCSVSMFTGRV